MEKFYEAYSQLKSELGVFEDRDLGKVACSLVYVKGGVYNQRTRVVEERANLIPDFLKAVLNIRTPRRELNGKFVESRMRVLLVKLGLKVEKVNNIHDFTPSFVSRQRLGELEKAIESSGVKPTYSKNIKYSGYNDVALINEKTGSDFVNFGPYGEGNHSPNEWVSVSSLGKTQRVYEKLIRQMCTVT